MSSSNFFRVLHVHFSFFWHFVDVLVLSTTWNDLFCICVDDVSIWWQRFNFVFLYLKCWFSSNLIPGYIEHMSWNNWEVIAEKRRYVLCGSNIKIAKNIQNTAPQSLYSCSMKKKTVRKYSEKWDDLENWQKWQLKFCTKIVVKSWWVDCGKIKETFLVFYKRRGGWAPPKDVGEGGWDPSPPSLPSPMI